MLCVLIDKWNETLKTCYENPKWLLAAAFHAIHDNRTAAKILGSRELLQEVKGITQKATTLERILLHSFK